MNQQAEMTQIPVDLVDKLEKEECVLFAGPGLSIPPKKYLGPPGPALLALEIAQRLEGQLDEYTLPWVAQCYAIQRGKSALNDYVSGRLGDTDYRYTYAQHLIPQFPFFTVVNTAQDILLREAYNKRGVKIKPVLGSSGSVRLIRSTFIQLYGIVEDVNTLKLTEDDIRKLIGGDTDLARDLRALAGNYTLLFLGYALNDPVFREFYFQLRLRESRRGIEEEIIPRAFLVWPQADQSDDRYWRPREANVIKMEPLDFLGQLAKMIAGRGNVDPLPEMPYEKPPMMSAKERNERANMLLLFSKQLGLVGAPEGSTQLQPIAGKLLHVRQVIQEQNLGENMDEDKEKFLSSSGVTQQTLNAQIKLQQGNVEWADGNLEQARVLFEGAIQIKPDMVDAYLSLYYLLVENVEYKEAMQIYAKILDLDPSRAFLPERFRLEAILGRTEIGISYKVFDYEREQLVTATVLKRVFAQRMEVLNKFFDRVKRLDVKGISSLLAYDRYGGHYYLITEYIEGILLSDHLHATGKLNLSEALNLLIQVGDTLEDACQAGIPHLGLEANNIVLSGSGVVLVNFGYQRLVESLPHGARAHANLQREYISPEQRSGKIGDERSDVYALGTEIGDERSDVYALGTLFYEMLFGRVPGIGEDQKIGKLIPDIGEAYDVLIERARSLDPLRRFPSVAEMLKELRRITLTTHRLWPAQYLRIGLSWISQAYRRLVTLQGGIFALALLVLILIFELVDLDILAPWRGITRFVLVILITTPATAALTNALVRETAHYYGLGSLIAGGRGMGAILGWLFTFYWFRIMDWGDDSLATVILGDLLGYIFLNFLFALAMSFTSILLIRSFALMGTSRGRPFLFGFYFSFLACLGLFILLAALRIPFGIMKF